MAFICSAALAIGIATIAVTEAARSVPGPTLWELTNKTVTLGVRPLIGFDSRIYSFCGVDLVGGDIWNVPYPNPDSCVENCKPETGCDAATWTNYNGGMCWFKHLQGSWVSAVPAIGAASFIRMDFDPQRYMGPTFPANVDMPGNDIDNRPASSSYDCIKICAVNSYCFAYTWTNYNGGTCWLKSKASPFVPSPGTSSSFTGRVTNPDTCLT